MLIGNRLLVCCVLTLVVVLGRFFATASASTARVTIVPGSVFFGVLGTTFAASSWRFPFLARSPKTSTVVSLPRKASAADCTSSGIAGPAGFAAGREDELCEESQPTANMDAKLSSKTATTAAMPFAAKFFHA